MPGISVQSISVKYVKANFLFVPHPAHNYSFLESSDTCHGHALDSAFPPVKNVRVFEHLSTGVSVKGSSFLVASQISIPHTRK